MSRLKPWADSPFDLILHAELCLRKGSDFDRRIALIIFDNSIEVSISTYLSLNPIMRKGKSYEKTEVEKWLNNYHTKLDFLFAEVESRGMTFSIERDELIWCHDIRNGQYHDGGSTIPRGRELDDIRKAAMETFSILFDISDVESLLEGRIVELDENKDLPRRTSDDDKCIDEQYGLIRIAGKPYYTSEALYGTDPFAYKDVATKIKAGLPLDEEVTDEL